MAQIVVLEDEASTRTLISSILKKAGHEVIAIDNGAEGLLHVMAEQPDLVVSDVEMPKMTGFEVLAHIRQDEETAELPVILLTSLSGRADIRKGMSEGANDYITKPFAPAELLESVQAQLARLEKRRGSGSSGPSSIFSPLSSEKTGSINKVLDTLPAVSEQQLDAHRLEQQRVSEAAAANRPQEASVVSAGQAWIMHIGILNHEDLKAMLSPQDWRLILRHLFAPVGRDTLLRAANYLDLTEHDLTLYYVDSLAQPGAALAAQALEALVRTAQMTRRWASGHFAQQPTVRVAIALHRGEISVTKVALPYGGTRDTVIGPAAEMTRKLRDSEPRVGWRVMATQDAVDMGPEIYKTGASIEVSVGTQDIAVHAIQGIAARYCSQPPVEASAWV